MQEHHEQTLTRLGVKNALRTHLHLSGAESRHVLEAILESLKQSILTQDHIKIFGFGTFLVHQKQPRLGRNPKTKKEVMISSRKSVGLRPSGRLLRLINTSIETQKNSGSLEERCSS